MSIERIKQLAGIKLNEGVSAVPCIGKRSTNENSYDKPSLNKAGDSHNTWETNYQQKSNLDDAAKRKSDAERKSQVSKVMFPNENDFMRAKKGMPAQEYKVGTTEGARPGTYEVPACQRKERGDKPYTLDDIKRHDYEDKISSKEMMAKRRAQIASGELTEEHDSSTVVAEFKSLIDRGVDPQRAINHTLDKLEAAGATPAEIIAAEEAILASFENEYGVDDADLDADLDADEFEPNRYNALPHPSERFEEEYNLNNGYDDINCADGDDYFPDGADSPVVKNVGPSGARQGDNPEQKHMQVAEVHKELVYGYRNYLKESNKK